MKFDRIVLIDKPPGWTSFDVVAKIRNYLKKEAGHKVKVGHTGTLDPLATGLMIVVVGSYTKRAAEFSKLDKTYEVIIKLGENSSTGDEEGEKTMINARQPSEDELRSTLEGFLGESLQIPPAHSAIKVNGKRAYKLARAGQEVVLEPRPIRINTIELNKYTYPFANVTVEVSSGTYIRSLVQDIGEKLGTGAYMSNLRRTKVGGFVLNESISGPADFDVSKIFTI